MIKSNFFAHKAIILKLTTAAMLFAQCLFAGPIYKSVKLSDGIPIELDLDRVSYFEIKDQIVRVRFADGTITPLNESLRSIQKGIIEVLQGQERAQFIPISRQAIVNPCYINKYTIFANKASLEVAGIELNVSRQATWSVDRLINEKFITEVSSIRVKGKNLRVCLLIGFCILAFEAQSQAGAAMPIESSKLKYGSRICPKEFVDQNRKALERIYYKLNASSHQFDNDALIDISSEYLDWRVNHHDINDISYKKLDLNELFIINELLLSILSDIQIYRSVIPVSPQDYHPGALGRVIGSSDDLFKECNCFNNYYSPKWHPILIIIFLIILFALLFMSLSWIYSRKNNFRF